MTKWLHWYLAARLWSSFQLFLLCLSDAVFSFPFPFLPFPFCSFPFLFFLFLFFFPLLLNFLKEVSNWREMEARPAKGWKSIIWMPVNLLWTIMSPMTKESKREAPYLAVQYNTMNWLNAVLDFIGAVSN